MNHILQLAPLTKQEMSQSPLINNLKMSHTPILPVPQEASHINYTNPELGGKPDALYLYHNKEGELLGYIGRWEAKTTKSGKKEFRPLCYVRDDKGQTRWRICSLPSPRPLYNLHLLTANTQKPILVCEGEKTALAAQQLFPDFIATTPMNGAQSASKTDWSVVKGRKIIIAADEDEAGHCFAEKIAELCQNADASSIWEINLKTIGKVTFCNEKPIARNIIPAGYDLADAATDGWTAKLLQRLLQDGKLLTPFISAKELLAMKAINSKKFKVSATGVYYAKEIKDEQDQYITEWVWMCSFLIVTHQTRDIEGRNWGRLCLLMDNDGNRKEYVLPMESTGASGEEYRKHLLSLGLVLAPRCNEKLHDYLVTSSTHARAICVPSVGWHKGRYVLAGKVLGAENAERLVLQTNGAPPPIFTTLGSLEQWQQAIGIYALGNSRLLLAISAALASGLMSLVQEENTALHWWGCSSIGKTTIAQIIASMWNAPVHSWRTTDNAAESLAVQANDGVLILDELGQVDAAAADALAYMLGNGQGKGRANRSGEARRVKKFRLLVISTGEMDLTHKMAERNLPTKAGQLVRFISLPAAAAEGYGIFEQLHGFADGAIFSNYLKKAAIEYRGSVVVAFLEKIAEYPDAIAGSVLKAKKAWLENVLKKFPAMDGQVQRVAGKFAYIAAVGELATSMGILPWPENAASDACEQCLKEWIASRGGFKASENTQATEILQSFLNRYGSSRFETPWNDTGEGNARSPNRAGFRKLNETVNNWEYYIFPEVFRQEICMGSDHNSIAAYLADRGYIQRDKQGKNQVSIRVPNHRQQRFYHVPAHAFAAVEG